MVASAEFGTLAAVRADLVGPEPQLVDVAGDRVLLHAEVRHPPVVDDVGRGDQHAHLLVDRDDQRVVHVEQVVIDLAHVDARIELAGLVAGTRQGGEVRDTFIDVVVLPLPLVPRDLDGHVGAAGVVDLDQRARGGDRHRDEDDDRDHGPDDLGLGVVLEGGRHGAFRLTERGDRIDHHAEHGHGNGDADPEDQHVQAVDLAAQFGDALAQVQGPGGRRRSRPQRGQGRRRNGPEGTLHLHWHYRNSRVKQAPPCWRRLPFPSRTPVTSTGHPARGTRSTCPPTGGAARPGRGALPR